MKALRAKYIRKHEDLELLINGRLPGSLLAGLDTQAECAQPGTPDHISRIQCQQTYYDVSCQVDGIDVSKGFSANPLIPIPYYQNKKTLEIDFPDNSFYVPGSGNIIDVEGCSIRQYMIICPQVSMRADECLEGIQSSVTQLPDSCVVRSVPESRPLIMEVQIGTLIAQRSSTPLTAE